MADVSITRLYGMPADVAFEAACTALADLSEYSVKQIHTEVLWGHWSSKGAQRAFVEIQVSPEGTGCRIDLELRNADLRDRLGLLRREANRVSKRIQQRLEGQITGHEPPPPPRAITDRMAIVGILIVAMMLGFGGSLYQMVMGI